QKRLRRSMGRYAACLIPVNLSISVKPTYSAAHRYRRGMTMGVDVTLRGRPSDNEHIPYFRQYIDLVPDGDILDILKRQIDETERYFLGFSAEAALWRSAPEEWNAIEVLGHLVDGE